MKVNLIIFDWKRTLYDPDTRVLIEGAKEVLEQIKTKNIPMVLIGKGGEDMGEEVKSLGVKEYFSEIIFAQGDKDPEVFKKFIDQNQPQETLIIGDRVRSELQIGNNLGATTIWIKKGKFASEEPISTDQEPRFTKDSLKELKDFLLVLE